VSLDRQPCFVAGLSGRCARSSHKVRAGMRAGEPPAIGLVDLG
jgi:hypothetical protein